MVLLVHRCHWLSGFRGFWLDKSETGNHDQLIETSLLGCIESVHAIIRCFVSLRRSSWISPDFGLWCSGSHTHIHIPHIVEHYVCTFLKLNTPCVPNYIELSNNTSSGVATLLLGEGAEFVSPLRPIIINVAYQQRRKKRIFFCRSQWRRNKLVARGGRSVLSLIATPLISTSSGELTYTDDVQRLCDLEGLMQDEEWTVVPVHFLTSVSVVITPDGSSHSRRQ